MAEGAAEMIDFYRNAHSHFGRAHLAPTRCAKHPLVGDHLRVIQRKGRHKTIDADRQRLLRPNIPRQRDKGARAHCDVFRIAAASRRKCDDLAIQPIRTDTLAQHDHTSEINIPVTSRPMRSTNTISVKWYLKSRNPSAAPAQPDASSNALL